MSESPTSVRQNQSVSSQLKEAVQELRNRSDAYETINKELTHLVFRLASNIEDLQKQIDDVKEDFKTNSDRVIIEVVGKIREDLDGYLDGQYTSDSTSQITN